MIINRVWAMPSHNTFSIKPIKDLISKYLLMQNVKMVDPEKEWIDPFSRNSPFSSLMTTNDLSPSFFADYHLESLEFLKQFADNSVNGVLFDPPYSPRQISECYKGVGRKVHMKDTQSSFYGDRKKEVARILKPEGIAICFGWNSNGIGKTNGFEMIEMLIVAHGGAHNDTICTVEKKSRLDTFI